MLRNTRPLHSDKAQQVVRKIIAGKAYNLHIYSNTQADMVYGRRKNPYPYNG
jgi:hypothetical protein